MASSEIIGQVWPVTIDSLERYSLLGRLASADEASPTPSEIYTDQVSTDQVSTAEIIAAQVTTGA